MDSNHHVKKLTKYPVLEAALHIAKRNNWMLTKKQHDAVIPPGSKGTSFLYNSGRSHKFFSRSPMLKKQNGGGKYVVRNEYIEAFEKKQKQESRTPLATPLATPTRATRATPTPTPTRATPQSNAESKTESNAESKPESKTESKTEPKTESKVSILGNRVREAVQVYDLRDQLPSDEQIPAGDKSVAKDFLRLKRIAALGTLSNNAVLVKHSPLLSESRRYYQALGKLLSDPEAYPHLSRQLGCLAGQFIGDGAGAPLEFKPFQLPGAPYRPDHDLRGAFKLPEMAATDDSSMGLCLLHSIILNGGCLNLLDQKVRYWCWWTGGYCNSSSNYPTSVDTSHHTGSVGLGGNIADQLGLKGNTWTETAVPKENECNRYNSGNGAAMKQGAIAALYGNRCSIGQVGFGAYIVSLVTHRGVESGMVCALLSCLQSSAMRQYHDRPRDLLESLESLWSDVVRPMFVDIYDETIYEREYHALDCLVASKPESKQFPAPPYAPHVITRNRDFTWRTKLPEDPLGVHKRPCGTYTGAYVMDCASIALNCIWHTTTFEAAVTRCIMMFGDADTTGSVTGQLAGAIYGMAGVMEAHGGRWWQMSQQHSSVWDACCLVLYSSLSC